MCVVSQENHDESPLGGAHMATWVRDQNLGTSTVNAEVTTAKCREHVSLEPIFGGHFLGPLLVGSFLVTLLVETSHGYLDLFIHCRRCHLRCNRSFWWISSVSRFADPEKNASVPTVVGDPVVQSLCDLRARLLITSPCLRSK